MAKGVFITGTGTDVGKTYISALIVKKLRQDGYRAGYYKAALSGAEKRNGVLVPGDAEYVCQVAELDEDPNRLVSYVYENAVSPHLAAKKENKPIEMEVICLDFHSIKKEFDYITVEGSGGLICPLRLDDKTIMLTDVIKALQLNVILVASASLGTINSTVLTVEYAKQKNIQIKGIILNGFEPNNEMHLDNQKQIEFLTGIPVIAHVMQFEDELDMKVETLKSIYTEVSL